MIIRRTVVAQRFSVKTNPSLPDNSKNRHLATYFKTTWWILFIPVLTYWKLERATL